MYNENEEPKNNLKDVSTKISVNLQTTANVQNTEDVFIDESQKK